LLVLLATAVFADSLSSFTIDNVKFAVVGSDGMRKGGESITFPDKLTSNYVVQGTDTLSVTLQVKDAAGKSVQPHQAFLVFTNEKTGVQSAQVLQVRESGKARVELSPKTDSIVGPYTLDLVLGTFSLPDSLRYSLGSVDFEPTIDLSKSSEAPAYYGGPPEVITYGPRPEITHVFRQPEETPALALSNGFVLVVLSPWLVLLGTWLSLGVTPAILGPFFSVSILTFFATLVGIEFLFYKYWTSLNIFETLTYLAGLAVVAFVTGQRALSEVRARRNLKHIKKE